MTNPNLGADSAQARIHPALAKARASEAVLCAVARLKGLTDDVIASSILAPKDAVQAFFAGRKVGCRDEIRDSLARLVGVDLASGRLAPDQVHFFMLQQLPAGTTAEMFRSYMRTAGFLLRGARFAELTFPKLSVPQRVTYRLRGVHVVQSRDARAVFIGAWCSTFRARFDGVEIAACRWAGGTQAKSQVAVEQKILGERLAAGDLTTLEFDEIFLGADATTWDDVETCARINRVSKDEIIEWIETIGARQALDRARASQKATPTLATHAGEIVDSWEDSSFEPVQRVARVAGGN